MPHVMSESPAYQKACSWTGTRRSPRPRRLFTMSPSDEHLTQSFHGEPELRAKKLSGAQLEGIADNPRVESYNSSLGTREKHGKNTDVASQELFKSIKRRREDIYTGGTAAKRPRNQTWSSARIIYDKERKISVWVVPLRSLHDSIMRALRKSGATETEDYGDALDI